ncbi:hypothetical protein Shyhy01_19770 [Streptomyces hygroscopicus subsp. hygroscopicus]|nr:hypothetical protein Shyhy01_19770 [Streptomyces hygroscopicus subsp. hygroscopicus]
MVTRYLPRLHLADPGQPRGLDTALLGLARAAHHVDRSTGQPGQEQRYPESRDLLDEFEENDERDTDPPDGDEDDVRAGRTASGAAW